MRLAPIARTCSTGDRCRRPAIPPLLLAALSLIAATPPPDPVQLRATEAARAEQAAEAAQLAATATLRATEDALAASEVDQRAFDVRAAELDRKVALQSAALAPLLVFAARRATAPLLGWLTHPAPPREAARGLVVIQYLAAELRDRAQALAEAQAALTTARRQAAARRDATLALRETQRGQAASLDASLAQARTVHVAATAELIESQRRATEATHATNLAAAVATVTKPLATPVPAAMAHEGWVVPVSGSRVGAFGAATEAGPATGMRFAPPSTARVVAPCDGRVAYAAPFRSYGGLVIVACADGLDAVLSGLDRIDVQIGQAVRAGAPAGTMPRWDPAEPPARHPTLMLQATRDGNPVDPGTLLR